MKATITSAIALLGIAAVASLAQAGGVACSPVFWRPLQQAPDACGPGFYTTDPCSFMVYGPNYYLQPATGPFQGIAPAGQVVMGKTLNSHGYGYQGPPNYYFNPVVRSPRDFFMWRENMEEQMRRETRAVFIP